MIRGFVFVGLFFFSFDHRVADEKIPEKNKKGYTK